MAEERAALHDFGLSGGGAGWVVLLCGGEGGVEPVGAPLPDVAGDGVEAEGVGWEAVDGAGSGEAVFGGVDAGELALPDVAEVAAIGRQVVAPGVEFLFEASAGGVLPLGFDRERLAGPCGVGCGVVPGDVDYGMVGAVVDVRAGAFGVLPGCSGDFAPPRGGGDGVFDEFVEAVGRKVGPEDEGPLEVFGFGEVVGGGDEGGEVAVGDGVGVDGEGREGDGADGALAVGGEGVAIVGAHEEGAAGECDGRASGSRGCGVGRGWLGFGGCVMLGRWGAARGNKVVVCLVVLVRVTHGSALGISLEHLRSHR